MKYNIFNLVTPEISNELKKLVYDSHGVVVNESNAGDMEILNLIIRSQGSLNELILFTSRIFHSDSLMIDKLETILEIITQKESLTIEKIDGVKRYYEKNLAMLRIESVFKLKKLSDILGFVSADVMTRPEIKEKVNEIQLHIKSKNNGLDVVDIRDKQKIRDLERELNKNLKNIKLSMKSEIFIMHFKTITEKMLERIQAALDLVSMFYSMKICADFKDYTMHDGRKFFDCIECLPINFISEYLMNSFELSDQKDANECKIEKINSQIKRMEYPKKKTGSVKSAICALQNKINSLRENNADIDHFLNDKEIMWQIPPESLELAGIRTGLNELVKFIFSISSYVDEARNIRNEFSLMQNEFDKYKGNLIDKIAQNIVYAKKNDIEFSKVSSKNNIESNLRFVDFLIPLYPNEFSPPSDASTKSWFEIFLSNIKSNEAMRDQNDTINIKNEFLAKILDMSKIVEGNEKFIQHQMGFHWEEVFPEFKEAIKKSCLKWSNKEDNLSFYLENYFNCEIETYCKDINEKYDANDFYKKSLARIKKHNDSCDSFITSIKDESFQDISQIEALISERESIFQSLSKHGADIASILRNLINGSGCNIPLELQKMLEYLQIYFEKKSIEECEECKELRLQIRDGVKIEQNSFGPKLIEMLRRKF